jgi:hypothetical protein
MDPSPPLPDGGRGVGEEGDDRKSGEKEVRGYVHFPSTPTLSITSTHFFRAVAILITSMIIFTRTNP